MNCPNWEERIALHAGGDLDGAEAVEVERHLADCPGCQVFWSGMRGTIADLRKTHAGETWAAELAVVRAQVVAEIDRGRRVWWRLAWVSGVAIAVAAVLAVLIQPPPLPPPPRQIAFQIPEAPMIRTVIRNPAPRKGVPRRATPVLVKWQTPDPNIVIYWIGDN
jgi:anti-sigma factor RsiW